MNAASREANVRSLNRLIAEGKTILDEAEKLEPLELDPDNPTPAENEMTDFRIDAERFNRWQMGCVELLEEIGANPDTIERFSDAEPFVESLRPLLKRLHKTRDRYEQKE